MARHRLFQEIVCCNKTIFQKHRKLRPPNMNDVNTYLEISKSIKHPHKIIFLEKDCNIDYENVIKYMPIVEHLERCYQKQVSFRISSTIYFAIMSLLTLMILLIIHPT